VSPGRLAAYGVLGMPLAMAALPIYVHAPKFYADTAGLPLATPGGLLLAARLADAVQDPLFGWWSDQRSHRRGGRWAFVAAGAVLMAAAMWALFHPPRQAVEAWFLASLVLVYTAYSLAAVSYQAYGAEIARDAAGRTRVTAWREGFGLAGVVLAAALPPLLGFGPYASMFAAVVVAATAITIAFSPPAAVVRRAAPFTWRALALPFANRRFRWLLAAFMASGIAAAVPATLVLFFVEDVLARPDLAGAFLVTYFACGAAGLPGWVWLSARIGKARAWQVSMALAIASFGWAFFLAPGDAGAFFAICALSGLALGGDLALPPSMLADAIDDDEARGAGRHEGAYFGLWNLATKLNLALAAGLALPLLAALGYTPGTPAPGREALSAVYALVPCALKLAAAALLARAPLQPPPGDPA
jgi:glycoside/pentoside/hexuronide:cation symporter, GPH family